MRKNVITSFLFIALGIIEASANVTIDKLQFWLIGITVISLLINEKHQ